MLPEPDRIRLQHMLDATREALAFAKGKAREDLDRDAMLFRALVNCIEVVGEAAAHVGEETKAGTPVVPWREIVGMRNRLIHVYFDISKNVVWSTVTHDLALLEPQLADILAANEAGA